MPPPPLPLAPRNGRSPSAQVSGSHPNPQHPTKRLQDFNNAQANTNTMEAKDSGTTNDHGLKPEYPFMSDKAIAVMSARSQEAMAEISRLCEPYLEPRSSIQDTPSMDLSPALIEELGLGFLFAQRVKGQLPGYWSEESMPTPAQTIHVGNVAHRDPPILSREHGTKRKEYDDGNEDYRHVQLDVEKQESRPRKQVKSVHHANAPTKHRAPYHDAASHSQQQHHLTPSSAASQVGISRGTAFGGPAPQVAPPAQPQWFASVEDVDPYTLYIDDNLNEEQVQTIDPSLLQKDPGTHLGTAFPSLQPFASSPYSHASAPEAQLSDLDSWVLPQSEAAETSDYDDLQGNPTMRHPSPMSSQVPNEQHFDPQLAATRPRSRADRGHHKQPSGRVESNHRYYPYVK